MSDQQKIADELNGYMANMVVGPARHDMFEPGIAKKLIGVPVRGTDGAVIGEIVEAEERIEYDGTDIHVHVTARLERPFVTIDIERISIE